MSADTLVVVAGGTGGHISPGIAVAEAAAARGLRVVFLSIQRNRNYPEFQNPVSWDMEWYAAPAFKKNITAILRFLPELLLSVVKAVRILHREHPRAVVALGGYPSFPAGIACTVMGIPFYLCEQNAVAGRVTRAFAKLARAVFLAFPVRNLKGAQAIVQGNPVRRSIRERAKARSRRRQAKAAPVVLALGGSQGAVQLNEMLLALWSRHPQFALRYRWILQTGRDHEASMRAAIDARVGPSLRRRIEIFGFDADIFRYYERADLFVGRAGAGNITEASLFGLPMVLIPYPFAKDDHQKANAACVVQAGAGRMISAEPEELVDAIDQLLSKKTLSSFRKASLALARPSAADDIVDAILVPARS